MKLLFGLMAGAMAGQKDVDRLITDPEKCCQKLKVSSVNLNFKYIYFCGV